MKVYAKVNVNSKFQASEHLKYHIFPLNKQKSSQFGMFLSKQYRIGLIKHTFFYLCVIIE